VIKQEFVAVLNLSLTLDVLEEVRPQLVITDVFINLQLLFVDIIATRYWARTDLVNLLTVLFIMTKLDFQNKKLTSLGLETA